MILDKLIAYHQLRCNIPYQNYLVRFLTIERSFISCVGKTLKLNPIKLKTLKLYMSIISAR